MTSSKAKKQKRASQWADVDGGYAFGIPYTTIRHSNFLRLSPHAVKLLIDLGRQYSGFNNGYLCESWALMKDAGWKSRDTLDLAVRECEHYRFIERTRQGDRNASNLYALTWWRVHEKPGKPLDRGPTFTPSNAWKDEQPTFNRVRPTRKKNISSNTPVVSRKHGPRVSRSEGHTPAVSHLQDSHAERVSEPA